MYKDIMLLSTNRDVGLDLQAELDDARAEIQDLRAENAALKRDLNAQRAHYQNEIAYLKRVMQHLLDSIVAAHPEYALPPPPPPSSLNQQMAQTNPYAIA